MLSLPRLSLFSPPAAPPAGGEPLDSQLVPGLQTGRPVPGTGALAPTEQAGRSNLMQLVQLRWLAVAGQLLAVLGVHFGLGVHLPLRAMLAFLAALALFNLASWLRARVARRVSDGELLAGLVVDLLMLTVMLGLSGGINNPFLFIFLPQVAVGALLLQRALAWALVLGSAVAIMALSQWHVPLAWPDAPAAPLSVHYVGGLLLCFVLSAALVVLVIVRIGTTVQRRDARLAALRQRAVEQDHIVRMGLLASGAAHELSTPLATLSVILGDWARMAPIAAEPELRDDVAQMQAQVQRCKTIISGILMSAGDARADATRTSTLAEFIHDLMADWCRRRNVGPLQAELGPLPDQPIMADAGLRQMVSNLLDNALEAAPTQLPRLLAECDSGTEGEPGQQRLLLRVLDRGPGFSAEMLDNLGRPYNSSKGRPGGGLGLFLSLNVARKLGGNLRAGNRETGGAEVLIDLPLSALTLPTAPTPVSTPAPAP